jgi:hypothetical protein
VYGGDKGEKARWTREKLGLPPVPEPVIDGVCTEILNAYAVISRSRRYAGMVAAPLPLSLDDISSYLALNPLLIDREEFEAAIFALDDAAREEWEKKQDKVK